MLFKRTSILIMEDWCWVLLINILLQVYYITLINFVMEIYLQLNHHNFKNCLLIYYIITYAFHKI